MTEPTFFNQILIWPFINVLIFFYKGFTSLSIPYPMGWAIIGLTIAIRGALHPLTKTQMESARKMQSLKPELDKLAKKYKDDKKKLQEEQVKLYQKYGVNPAAGCLPMLLQFPILIALYQVFYRILSNGNIEETTTAINQIVYHQALKIGSLDLTFFGLNLGSMPSQWQERGWWLLLLPVITAVLQWYQTKQLMPTAATPAKKQADGKEQKKEESFAEEMQKQMTLLMPIMIGFFSYSLPVGLSLYWNTYTVLALVNGKKKSG